MNNQFAKGYAEALFDLTLEKGNIDQVNDELKVLVNSLKDNNDFVKILNHPQINKTEKKQLINNIYSNFQKVIVNFLCVLVDNDRVGDVNDIHNEFTNIYNDYQNILFVKAYSSIELDKSQVDRLKVKLMIKYRHKIEIVNIVDKSVIGGIKLVINEDIIDFTINNQIKNLKSHVLKQI